MNDRDRMDEWDGEAFDEEIEVIVPPQPVRIRKGNITDGGILTMLTVFELIALTRLLLGIEGELYQWLELLPYPAMMVVQWVYYAVMKRALRMDLRLELSAFFLCAVGMGALLGADAPLAAWTQLAALVGGLAVYHVILWAMKDLERAEKVKIWAGAISVLLLAINVVFGSVVSGAKNWIVIGSFTFQPSELVKVAFVLTGTATLERLQSSRHLTWFLGFFVVCMGALMLMGDFGTACVFFVTFLVIAFMRSGDWKTIFFIIAGAAAGGALVLTVKPYIARRFEAWGNVWAYADSSGYQQTRLLVAVASGGLLGLGPGRGELKRIFAATTDLIFGVVCEEWGLLLALCVVAVYVGWAVYACRLCARTRSTLYSISACAAVTMMLFQAGLNIFGVVDILPLTGVTLPFVSRGGTSMLASWGLLAFLKAASISAGEGRE